MAREAYISGIGMSEIGVRLPRSPLMLTWDATQAALADAGLTLDQIDGVATYPGKMTEVPGFSPLSADDIIEAFGMTTRWHAGGLELTAQLAAIENAAMAVKTGQARHVLCFRTVYEAGARANPKDYPVTITPGGLSGYAQWLIPYGAMSASTWFAHFACRHMHEYGMTKEHLGHVVMNAHANSALNPKGFFDKPLTMDEYMAARPVTTPFGLYDCDRFTDGATVIIVTAEDALDEVSAEPIRIAASAGSVERYSWDQAEWPSSYPTGRGLWLNTDYTIDDVDMLQFYDGFSFLPFTWLEGLGFCGNGEAHHFIDGGKTIARDGPLPMNTSGGQLGAGRLHGFGFAHESVLQLRRQAGARQVGGDPKISIATSGGGPMACALLLAKD